MNGDDDKGRDRRPRVDLPPWFPPPATPGGPSVREQLSCPPGFHREFGRGCVRNAPELGSLSMLSQPGGPSVADRPRPAPRVPSIADLAFAFIFGGAQPSPAPRPARRPPRRRRSPAPKRRPARRRTPSTRPAPAPIPEGPPAPAPDRPAPSRLPLPRVKDLPWRGVPFIIEEWRRYIEGPRPVPRTPGPPTRTSPRTRPTTFPPLPAPAIPGPRAIPVDLPTRSPRGFPERVPGPSYDPFIVAPPAGRPVFTPSPTPASRPATQPRIAFPLAPGFPSSRPRPSRAPAPRAQPSLRQLEQPGSPLTPVQPGPLGLGRITVASPTADPCAVRVRDARRKQRERRKECKKFVTKTIRVCADKE